MPTRRLGSIVLASLLLSVPATAEDVPGLDDCCFIVEFEDAFPGECLNEKYAHLGIHMFATGSNSYCIHGLDVERLGWWSPTLPMAASTVTAVDGALDSGQRFNMRFDRSATRVRACFGSFRPDMSLQYRCDFPNGWSGGYGPLDGTVDLDESRGGNRCDTIWFQERFGRYPITLDRLQISFCPKYDSCRVVGDGDTYVLPIEGPADLDLCSPDFPPL